MCWIGICSCKRALVSPLRCSPLVLVCPLLLSRASWSRVTAAAHSTGGPNLSFTSTALVSTKPLHCHYHPSSQLERCNADILDHALKSWDEQFPRKSSLSVCHHQHPALKWSRERERERVADIWTLHTPHIALSSPLVVFVQIVKSIYPNSKMYLSKLQNVFVQITKCICPNCRYLDTPHNQYCSLLPALLKTADRQILKRLQMQTSALLLHSLATCL